MRQTISVISFFLSLGVITFSLLAPLVVSQETGCYWFLLTLPASIVVGALLLGSFNTTKYDSHEKSE